MQPYKVKNHRRYNACKNQSMTRKNVLKTRATSAININICSRKAKRRRFAVENKNFLLL